MGKNMQKKKNNNNNNNNYLNNVKAKNLLV